MYQKLDELEFGIMELPRPDAVIFLYMPFEYAAILKKNREETPDQHESNKAHLEQAEKAYLELTEKYNYIKVRTTSDLVGADFIFYRPISSKELLSLLAGNRKWWLLFIPLLFWLILPFILLHFYGDMDGNLDNTGLFIEFAYTLVLIICVLFINNKDKNILQKYGDDIVMIEK